MVSHWGQWKPLVFQWFPVEFNENSSESFGKSMFFPNKKWGCKISLKIHWFCYVCKIFRTGVENYSGIQTICQGMFKIPLFLNCYCPQLPTARSSSSPSPRPRGQAKPARGGGLEALGDAWRGSMLLGLRGCSDKTGLMGLAKVFGLGRVFGLDRGTLGDVWRGCVL